MKKIGCAWVVVLGVAQAALAQWESGSDGSDGAFAPAVSTVVDLSLAASLCDCDGDTQIDDPCRWDCPSPVPGRGVYDAQQWVVVYKYTTVNVASGATITFGMHPSGAPVTWLATGTVTINGSINLDGEDGVGPNPSVLPYFSRPGPGGFEGGQAGHAGAIGALSYGYGPGASPTSPILGSYASVGQRCFAFSTGPTYGNSSLVQLIGGSGGGSEHQISGGSGGAGGGAMLIASTTQISVGTAGKLKFEGGLYNQDGAISGSGSGGAVRLRGESIILASGSQLLGKGGYPGACGSAQGGDGRIRIEANSIANSGQLDVVNASSISIVNTPGVIFPATPPTLKVTSVCGEAAPADPGWGIMTTDVDVDSGSPCTVNIEGTGMPTGTIVVVRVIPARGNIISVNSTPMVDAGGGLRTATASVTFPGGRSELQLRANW